MARDREGLNKAIRQIAALGEAFQSEAYVTGRDSELNKNLEMAGRIADFLELGELMAIDALEREESCGCHFREEHQSEEGEALRNDRDFAYVAAWEHSDNGKPKLHKEPLVFENVEMKTRSYK